MVFAPTRPPGEVFRPDDATPTVAPTPTTTEQVDTATVVGAMHTPDGAWQVDIMQRNRRQWYRITNGDNVLDWLTVDAVQQILRDAGIDLADLTEHQPPTKPETQKDVE